MKKIIVIVLCIAVLISCGDKGSGSNDDRTILVIGGHDVTYDEYLYFYQNTKLDLEYSDPNYEKRELLDTVKSTLVRHYAVYNLAEQYDIELTSDMEKAVDEEVEYTIEAFGGKDEYYNQLALNNMTGDCYRKILEINQIEIAVREYLMDEFTSDIPSDDEIVEDDFNKNFVRATHILITKNNGNTDEVNRNHAEELSNRIKNGEDFDELQKKYGEDIGIDYKNGYYMTHGLYNETFENTAYSLDVNEISGVVESSVGFHIIKRLPLDINYLYNNYEDIRYIYKNRVVNERLDAIAETLSVEYTDVYNEMLSQ